MADTWLPASRPDALAFLVEDVVLTLANLRGALDWLAAEPDPARRATALDRIERQIGLIEDRARHILRRPDQPPQTADSRVGEIGGPNFRSRRRPPS